MARRLLLVDDDRQTRIKLTRMLEAIGHEVIVADGGRRALEALASEPVDLVVLDLMMPDMDGFAVLEEMRNRPDMRSIPVVVVSALQEPDTDEKCRALGASSYLEKPIDAAQLEASIEAGLRASAP